MAGICHKTSSRIILCPCTRGEIGSITQIVPHGYNAFHAARTTASQPLVYIASLPRALLSGNGSTGLLSDQPFVARGRKRDVGQTSLAL